MNPLSFSRLFVACCAWLAATTIASATDISGVYDDKGIVMTSSQPEQVEQEVSLHALLSLEFDPEAGRVMYEDTHRVDLVQASDEILIRAHKEKNRVSWRTEYLYEAEKGSIHGPRVIVNTRKPGEREVYTYMFELLENKDHLLVTVYRVSATIVGPSGTPIGSYLFTRMAEAK
ncbi:hypothetical protein MASR2M8_16040 [Opitutaceae bacterium]